MRNSQHVALKVSKRPSRRFADEIKIHRELREVSGVLPFIDADDSTRPVWLATVEALPIEHALAKGDIRDVVVMVTQLAETLANLADDEIFHRDIKPSNIFIFAGEAVLGDFGLAHFKSKTALTTNERKLGPWGFIAPEMLNTPRDAQPGPADVYSLAKSFWCLASGQNYPLPGEHRLEFPPVRLSSVVRGEGVAMLDPILDRCTRLDPGERPAMRDLFEELNSWLRGPRPSETDDPLQHLLERAQAILAPERADSGLQQRVYNRAYAVELELQRLFVPLQNQFSALQLPSRLQPGETPDIWYDYIGQADFGGGGNASQLGPIVGTDVWLWLGYGWGTFRDGRAMVSAALVRGDGSDHNAVCQYQIVVEPGTARATAEIEHMVARVRQALAPAVSDLLDTIETARR